MGGVGRLHVFCPGRRGPLGVFRRGVAVGCEREGLPEGGDVVEEELQGVEVVAGVGAVESERAGRGPARCGRRPGTVPLRSTDQAARNQSGLVTRGARSVLRLRSSSSSSSWTRWSMFVSRDVSRL